MRHGFSSSRHVTERQLSKTLCKPFDILGDMTKPWVVHPWSWEWIHNTDVISLNHQICESRLSRELQCPSTYMLVFRPLHCLQPVDLLLTLLPWPRPSHSGSWPQHLSSSSPRRSQHQSSTWKYILEEDAIQYHPVATPGILSSVFLFYFEKILDNFNLF